MEINNKDKFYYFTTIGADELLETSDLSAEAMGCKYIMECYLCKKTHLPKNKKQLIQICRGADWSEIQSALRHMQESENGYVSVKILEARLRAIEISQTRQAAGILGAAARWGSK